ncbi:MAG: aldose epimerase family protein [Alistipes finegoldii]
MKRYLFLMATTACMLSCAGNGDSGNGVELLDAAAFRTEIDGKPVGLYTLQNADGMTVQLTNYGARVVALWVPAADGRFRDVVWGYDSIDAYLRTADKYCGPVVGRFGNRIGKGRFTLDGKEYQLTINNGENHLHGGPGGFECRVWDARETTTPEGNPAVAMSYRSADGEEGYPGNLDITVTYSLTPDNGLVIDYEATTDAPTIVNPTSHVYYNLHGTTEHSTDSHLLTIHASGFTPTDAGLIPTGEILPVEGTPLDFRTPHAIGERIGQTDYEPLAFGNGYDHNWALDKPEAGTVSLAAEAYEPATGIRMKIYADQPGLQFYAGQGMDGKEVGKRGDRHNFRSGIALETQNFPDAPNHDNFPSSVLASGRDLHAAYGLRIRNRRAITSP